MIFHLKRSCIKFKHKIKCVFLVQGDVILLTGVRCTEETYTDGANGVRTTVYRLIIPDERNIDCRVLPAEHSSTKQVCIFINHLLMKVLQNCYRLLMEKFTLSWSIQFKCDNFVSLVSQSIDHSSSSLQYKSWILNFCFYFKRLINR